jgi:hypothetical protein
VRDMATGTSCLETAISEMCPGCAALHIDKWNILQDLCDAVLPHASGIDHVGPTGDALFSFEVALYAADTHETFLRQN